MSEPAAPATVTLHNALDGGATRTLAEDVRNGLTRPAKELPPKHLYDTRGAVLFEQICALPEYYPTRLERSILERVAAEVIAASAAGELVELGSGSAAKTRLLLDAMSAAGTLRRFIAVDVTEQAVRDSASDLASEYSGLDVHGLIGDFERHLDHLPPPREPRLLAFLGGTIGNFAPTARLRFLSQIADLLRPADHLLLGTDLIKDRSVLEAAYDDSAGVTAEFNRNILHVLNRELDGNFDPQAFDHVALFDEEHEWIEMRLRALAAQDVTLAALPLRVSFAAGEEIRTEISAKFTRARVEAELEAAGLELVGWYTDPDAWFALSLARRA